MDLRRKIDWTPAKVRWLTYGGIVIAYGVLWGILFRNALTWRPWIELLNGATWPEHADGLFIHSPPLFSGLLTLRVMLNVSALIAAAVFLVEFFLIKERSVMKVSTLLDSRQKAVLNAVAAAMEITTIEQRMVIEKAAAKAAQAWNERYLPGLIGPKAAQQVMNAYLPPKGGSSPDVPLG